MKRPQADPLFELFKSVPPVRRESTTPLSKRFLELDDRLHSEGVKPATDWWRERVCKWLDRYENEHVLELWGAVGRGAAKSTLSYKLITLLALYGDFDIPKGETHYFVCLSRIKEEAQKGVAIIARWLTLLGIDYERRGDVINLVGTQRGIRVVSASVQAATGWRACAVFLDEFAKYATGGVDMADADEVRSSAIAMTATHTRAPIITFSSPWIATGSFYEAINSGSDSNKEVIGPAPTWIAAPHITEADCRRKEPNQRRFVREYACVFSAGANSVFTTEVVDRAMAAWNKLQIDSKAEPVLVIDGSRGGDRWAWGVVRMVWAEGKERLLVESIGGVPDATNSEAAVAWLAAKAKSVGAQMVIGDQFEAGAMRSMFGSHKLSFTENTWVNKTKVAAVDRAERLFRDQKILIPPDPELRTELLQYKEKLTKTGETTYEGKRDDLVAILLTATMSLIENTLPLAPEPAKKEVLTQQQVGEAFERRWVETTEQAMKEKREFEDYFGGSGIFE